MWNKEKKLIYRILRWLTLLLWNTKQKHVNETMPHFLLCTINCEKQFFVHSFWLECHSSAIFTSINKRSPISFAHSSMHVWMSTTIMRSNAITSFPLFTLELMWKFPVQALWVFCCLSMPGCFFAPFFFWSYNKIKGRLHVFFCLFSLIYIEITVT